MIHNTYRRYIAAFTLTLTLTSAIMADQNEDLAKELANPIASLISLPLQYNYDSDIGQFDKGSRSLVNIQPVIPFSMNDDWNLISRTILPVIWQSDTVPGAGSQSGTGNIVQSLFFSPKAPTEDGWIWGAGPVFLIPTATDDLLGGEQWGAGPTVVALKQNGPWTYGGLANHIYSFAKDENAKISNTFLQPFLTYVTPEAISYALNTESTYNWETKEWAVPINFTVTKLMKFGNQRVSVGGGVRYWVMSDSTISPEGLGARLICTFLFPK